MPTYVYQCESIYSQTTAYIAHAIAPSQTSQQSGSNLKPYPLSQVTLSSLDWCVIFSLPPSDLVLMTVIRISCILTQSPNYQKSSSSQTGWAYHRGYRVIIACIERSNYTRLYATHSLGTTTYNSLLRPMSHDYLQAIGNIHSSSDRFNVGGIPVAFLPWMTI